MTKEDQILSQLGAIDKQLKVNTEDTCLIKRAVIGEESTGQNGLVKDVAELKAWRSKVTIKVASISGALTVVMLIAKYIFLEKK